MSEAYNLITLFPPHPSLPSLRRVADVKDPRAESDRYVRLAPTECDCTLCVGGGLQTRSIPRKGVGALDIGVCRGSLLWRGLKVVGYN